MKVLVVALLTFFALVIDGFTFLVSLALSVVAAAPGTFGGCAVGAAVAGKAGCAVLGLLGSFPIINGALATFTEPVGIVLGITITICINCTLGSILILFLIFARIFDGKTVVGCLIGEALPGVSMLPLWTGMVIRCSMKAAKKGEFGAVLGVAATLGGGLSLSNISKVNPSIGAAAQQGQRIGAIAQVNPDEYGSEELDTAREESFSEAKVNLKASVDRFKSNINNDITPKVSPPYGKEIPA